MKYLIWWTSQADCERIVPLDTWPSYLGREFSSRMGRAGRGRLWVPSKFDYDEELPQGVGIEWDVANNWLCKAANDAGGIVIPMSDIHHVQFLPGFVTTFDMELPDATALTAA